jgi:hypothetical protein
MKPQTSLAAIVFLVLSLASVSARDSRYFSYIIHPTDDPVHFDLPANLYMEVVTFSQTSSGATNQVGSVTVTKFGGDASVMFATQPTSSTTNPVFVAGPCTVTVHPVTGATLFITFLLGWN